MISNADPRTTLRLLGDAADSSWREQVQSIPIEGCTLKLNVWLRELPNFRARPGACEAHHFGQINTPLTKQEWKAGYAAAREGRLPDRLWTELYFQSVHDRSIAPPGTHTMSVFSQYVPYEFADGTWDQHREEAKQRALAALARFCTNIPDAVIDAQALGPPDIEKKVGSDRRAYFPGRVPASIYVEQPPSCEDAHAGRLSVRRMHASGRQRHRDQWPQCRYGRARGLLIFRLAFSHWFRANNTTATGNTAKYGQ